MAPNIAPPACCGAARSYGEESQPRGTRLLTLSAHLQSGDSIFTELADPERSPEVLTLRDSIRAWRFYDHFRTDAEAPARRPQLGTATPVLHHDGRDLPLPYKLFLRLAIKRHLIMR